MKIELPHESDSTLEEIAQWLRKLADGVENSNSTAEKVATQAYRLAGYPTDAVREAIAEVAEIAMDDINDMDVTFADFAMAIAHHLLPHPVQS